MATYGRNFDFRVPPVGNERAGRHVLNVTNLSASQLTAGVPIGAPLALDTSIAVSSTFSGATNVKLQKGATPGIAGRHGILVYEHAPAAFAGNDPALTTYSDKDTAPVGKLVQMVNGPSVKVLFRNTTTQTFLTERTYTGRVLVAGVSLATPTVAVGDYLTPSDYCNDTDGFWVESNSTNGWLVVLSVDAARDEVEARMVF